MYFESKKGATMGQETEHKIKISVRNLVEFILRSGNIDSSSVGVADKEAMQKGSKLHRKIQKRMGSDYTAEYPLSLDVPVTYEKNSFTITVEGRADGILLKKEDEKTPGVFIDEIKGVYLDVTKLEEPIPVHLAQAKCYAYMYAILKGESRMGVRMTYANLESEVMKYFEEVYETTELNAWFEYLINEYAKWANFQIEWQKERNESLKQLEFPFTYREGQKRLVTGVYQSILRNKRLYIEAPTGVGKTISTVFPTVKAMGEGLVSKIFYLTAKTITRTVALDTFSILKQADAKLKVVALTAKEKICCLDSVNCNPESCERACGHFDRVNDAVFDLITHEQNITREVIEEYAKDYCVCPFEMTLDVSLWVDVIVCDYNYVFDPSASLKRFFQNEKKQEFAFLIDEAHNLVDRAREMYSATLKKEDFLAVKRIVGTRSKKLTGYLETCNRDLLAFKRESEEYVIRKDIDTFVLHLMRLSSEYYEFLREHQVFDERETMLNFYFEIQQFLSMSELYDEKYLIYTDFNEQREFLIRLQCMDPSTNLNRCLEKGRSAIFFSATLLPISYYKEQLAGREEDYAIYAHSTFQPEKRLLLIGSDVSTKYTSRTRSEYEKVACYIEEVVGKRVGNYFVFFPSYQYMNQIIEVFEEKKLTGESSLLDQIVMQGTSMTETEKEEFLNQFVHEPKSSCIGFCVMGGMFSEGIDLKADRLIGTIIVGTGLPMVCTEKEIFRQYYETMKGQGFAYSYLYNGMNKVLQSGGRVIRTEEDEGVVVLLDKRFLTDSYLELFPREWFPYTVVNRKNVGNVIEEFWKNRDCRT